MDSLDAVLKQAETLRCSGDPDAALEVLNAAIVLNENAAQLRAARAHIYSLSGSVDRAISDLREACRFEPHEPHYQFTLGYEFANASRYDEAIEAFTRAIELGEAAEWDYYTSAAVLLRAASFAHLGQLSKARADCERITDEDGFWLHGHLTKQIVLDRIERLEKQRRPNDSG